MYLCSQNLSVSAIPMTCDRRWAGFRDTFHHILSLILYMSEIKNDRLFFKTVIHQVNLIYCKNNFGSTRPYSSWRISKCKCGPEELPVLPINPITSPWNTEAPQP